MAQDSASVIQAAAEAFNKGQAEGLTKVFGGEHARGAGESMKTMRGAFPDLHYTIDHVHADGPHVTFSYTVKGTHKGALGDLKATGKSAQWHGSGVATVEGGKIVAVHTTEDWLRAALQLGIAVNPTMTGTWVGSSQGTTVTLKLTQSGTNVTGTATVSGLPDSFPVSGTNNYPNVVLKGTAYGLAVTLTGTFTGPNTISGTMTIQGFPPTAVVLNRQ